MIKLYSAKMVGYRCEECGRMFTEPVIDVIEYENIQYKKCPYCGARGEAEVYNAT